MSSLTFDTSYFKDQKISNFYVPEMMKRAWAAHLQILEELKALFDKYDLKYFADFGTLLGAIRHNGIIPWDDDIDISMPRKDFNILLEHADEIGGGLFIRSIYNTESYYNFHAVATNSGGTKRFELDKDRMENFYGCPFFCYVDIYPLDYVYRDPKKFQLQKGMYYIAYKCVYDCVNIEEKYLSGKMVRISDLKALVAEKRLDQVGTKQVKDLLGNIEVLRTYLKRNLPAAAFYLNDKKLRNQLCKIADMIAQMCDEKDADKVEYFPHLATYKDDTLRSKEWFDETIEHKFENTTISIPKGYEGVLKVRFGENYMTPKRQAAAHEYPYYRTLIEVMVDGDTGEVYPEYKQKPEILAAVDSMIEFQTQVSSKANHGSYGAARNMLRELQEYAVSIGNAIEERKGEGVWLVEPLEEYCEGIYEFCVAIDNVQASTSDPDDVREADKRLGELADKARATIVKGYHQNVPENWIGRLTKEDGSRKKVIIYGLSAIELIGHGELSAHKLLQSFEEFDKNSEEACVILCFPEKLSQVLHWCNLGMSSAYDEVLAECCSKDYVIVPEKEELELVVSIGDVYYGDECPLMDKFKTTRKPIMIQDYMC